MNSKHYACIFSALYVGLLVAAFMLVSIAPRQVAMEQHDVMYVEFIEPETPPEPKPKEVKRDRKVTTPVPNRTPKVSENPPHKQLVPFDVSFLLCYLFSTKFYYRFNFILF